MNLYIDFANIKYSDKIEVCNAFSFVIYLLFHILIVSLHRKCCQILLCSFYDNSSLLTSVERTACCDASPVERPE